MNSYTTKRFREKLADLPEETQKQAKKTYIKFKKDPYHPSLNFKRVHSSRPIYSVRITRDYRAVGTQENGDIIWFWIGSHSDYDNLLKRL